MTYPQPEYPEKDYNKPGDQKIEGIQTAQPVTVKVKLPDSKAYVTYVFIGLSVVVFLLQQVSNSLLGGDLPMALGAKINEYIQAGQVWRLFTPMLLHGSILHILFNMYALYIIGPGLEKYYGHLRFFLLYILAGYAGNLFSFMFTDVVSVGASTAIFGMVVAQALFIYRNRFLFGNQARSLLINVVGILAVNLILGLSPGIDNWGHLGGLVGGLVFAWFAGPVLKVDREGVDYVLKDTRTMEIAWAAAITVGCVITFIAGLWIWLY
jgi:rhomboid protease GluP